MSTVLNRRPLKVRGSKFARNFAAFLTEKDITPNHISLFSIVFAIACSICFLLIPFVPGFFKFFMLILGAVFIQCRLLCNLFDGMVAVEGGKTTPSGELFNDIPDRVADPLILVAAGYAAFSFLHDWALVAGWLSGILAVFTAYVRTLSCSIGAPADFRGPMAKQHRMAVMTIACLLSALESLIYGYSGAILFFALAVIIIGCVITIYLRIRSAYRYLETN